MLPMHKIHTLEHMLEHLVPHVASAQNTSCTSVVLANASNQKEQHIASGMRFS